MSAGPDPGQESATVQAAREGVTGSFPRSEATYAALAGLFMVTLVLTNVIASKLFEVSVPEALQGVTGGATLTLTAGLVTYPITFLLTDTVAEIWGQRRATFMVYTGFFMSFVMMAVLWIAVALPPSAAWTYPSFSSTEASQVAYEATFSAPGVLVMASMTAYLVAQLIDVRLYHFWWRLTGGKHLWLRNNGSTWISQLVDTIIVNSIFLRFGLDLEWGVIGSIIVASYFAKLLIAALDTPLIYASRAALERWLGIPHDPARRSAPLE
ncbi:MAG: queuosine precursor transporter [Planctomycetota bacterium]|nr:queuosine precursor transporter [Planctomycetota bacterium]MEC8512016.1 queuosine precursor transporter [Planctomycetota bacterium]